nr:hypothetical protein [uncultured Microbulbifer sp.]
MAPILQAATLYGSRAAEKLRAQKSLVKSIHLFLHTSPHEPNYYSRSTVVQTPYPTDDTRVIVRLVRETIADLYRPGCRFMKAGVGLIEIIPRALGLGVYSPQGNRLEQGRPCKRWTGSIKSSAAGHCF